MMRGLVLSAFMINCPESFAFMEANADLGEVVMAVAPEPVQMGRAFFIAGGNAPCEPEPETLPEYEFWPGDKCDSAYRSVIPGLVEILYDGGAGCRRDSIVDTREEHIYLGPRIGWIRIETKPTQRDQLDFIEAKKYSKEHAGLG